MKPISYGIISRLIRSTKEFKQFKKAFIGRLNEFCMYPEAVDITVSGGFSFILSAAPNSWPDEVKEYIICASCNTRCIMSKEVFNASEYFELMAKHIIEDITKSFNEYYNKLRLEYKVLKNIRLKEFPADSDINFPIYDTRFLAWNYDSVGIYYVEQECGSHWIILPRNIVQDQPSLHRDIDRNSE